MSKHKRRIPLKANALLASIIVLVILTQLFLLPVLLAHSPWIMALVVIAFIPLNTPLWSLIHEAIHNNFYPDSKRNELCGRFMSVIFGGSFFLLRFGHLMHHRFNRDWESEFYTAEQGALSAWVGHYAKMLGGLYIMEVIGSFLIAILPRSFSVRMCRKLFPDEQHFHAVQNVLLKERYVRATRVDCALIVLLYGAAFTVYGANWPVLVLLIYGRGLIVSLFDNAYHYGTPADNSVEAKELKVPSLYRRFILNFNHHHTHHRNVGLPWSELPADRKAKEIPYDEGFFQAVLKQFRGPVKQG